MSRHAQKGVNCLDCHQPAAGQQQQGPPRLRRLDEADGRQLPELPRADLPGVPAQPARRAVVGGGLRRGRPDAGAGRVLRALSAGRHAARRASAGRRSKARRRRRAAARSATASAGRTTTARSARAPRATRATPRRSRSRGCRRPAASATWVPIIRSSRSTRSRSTASMFRAQEKLLKLDAPPKTLTTRDMFVPTCATCHMSGLNGQKVTHDPSERLSYYLADPITKPRPNHDRAQVAMKQLCVQCHTPPLVDRVYTEAEKVVASTNEQVQAASDIVAGAAQGRRADRARRSAQPIDFVYFDLWHYDGRTSKHGAFMGGADFVQWHGNYPMLARTVELRAHGRGAAARSMAIVHAARVTGGPTTSSGSSCSSLVNFAGLIVDIYLAHSENQLPPRRPSTSRCTSRRGDARRCWPSCRCDARVPRVWRDVGHLVGWLAVAGRADRRRAASRQPVLLRAHAQQPDLCGAVRGAARVHRPGAAAHREPDGRPATTRVGAVDAAAGARRLRRQLRLQPDRSRAERLLQPARMAAGRQQRVRGRLSAGAVPDRGDAAVSAAVRSRARRCRRWSACSASVPPVAAVVRQPGADACSSGS